MSTLQVAIQRYGLPLAQAWVTARGRLTYREGYLVRITAPDGTAGYGEAAPLPGHGGEELSETLAALRSLADWLQLAVGADASGLPEDVAGWRALAAELAEVAPTAPAARAGLDLALADLASRRAGVPLARWWRAEALSRVPVNGVIGAVAPAEAARQARELVGAGFRTIKVKVGGGQGSDVDRLAAVRQAVGRGIALRADANGAWSEDQALVELRRLAAFGLEYVEQPVLAADIEALARVRRASPIAVAADECLLLAGGPERVLALGAADVLVLKPALMGGPSVAWQVAEAAGERGLAVVITAALESAVGHTGALHLAAAVLSGGEPLACGLATGSLLARDTAEVPPPSSGVLRIPPAPGLGVVPGGSFEVVGPQAHG